MSDKPTPIPSPSFALPGQGVVALQGRDAIAFAQAQTMNDVAALGDGHWQWSGWLTPKGRVIALFALLRLDPETVWLLLSDADPQDIAARLRRFVFRSKLAIDVREDLHIAGAFAAPRIAAGAAIGDDPATGIELDFGAEGGPRTLRIGTDPASDDADALARWRAFDLEHGLPRLAAAQSEQWTPQQLSLERLQAFSVKKGCYPGQEIVARTHFLGQAKRGLALLQVADAAVEGDKATQDGAEIGEVICTARADRTLALAVLPLQRTVAPVEIAGQAAVELPVRAGLRR